MSERVAEMSNGRRAGAEDAPGRAAHSCEPPPSPGFVRSSMTLRTEPWSEVVCAQWRALERRVMNVPLASSSSWTAAWWTAYGDAVDARVAIAERDGRTLGMALLVRSRQHKAGPIGISTCHVGTAGEAPGESACVEYNGLLVEDGARREFAQGLMELATADRSIDEVRLDGFDGAGAENLLVSLPGAEATSRVSRYFDLAAARARGVSVMDVLGGNTRSSLRRALRKTGEVDVAQARSLDEADDMLTELIELHQARWRASGQPGAFASARFTRFQRELIARLWPEERVVLLRARSSVTTIGCLLLLADRGRLLDYVSGFAAFDQTPSPGIVTHYLAMERALGQGYEAYDFLVGDKRHKSNLATDERELVWGVWRRPNWKNQAIAGLRSVKRAIADLRSVRPVEAAADTGEEAGA